MGHKYLISNRQLCSRFHGTVFVILLYASCSYVHAKFKNYATNKLYQKRMKGLNFLEGMNLTLQKPFVIRFFAKINMREREMC